MPNLLDRPYQGNWQPNARQVVRHTPDALIFVNGDLSVPGCAQCNGRIDLQRFVRSISIEAGTTPGSLSGNVSLSLPAVARDTLFKEGRALLRAGLEIHVYMRGYFPVQGQFAHLQNESLNIGADQVQLGNYSTYPYYPVFHGVTTGFSYDYSDGFYSASMPFQSLLHFWQYHNMAMNGAVLGSRPEGSDVKPNLWANIFSNMHPYGIMYTLYRSTAGAAGGVEFVLDDATNLDAFSEVTGQQLYKMSLMYWEERFKTGIQNLRMYGVNGTLFNSVQQAFLSRRNTDQLEGLLNNARFMDADNLYDVKDPFSGDLAVADRLGLSAGGLDLTFADRVVAEREPGQQGPLSLNITSMYAFTRAFGDAGGISEFETTYQTKLDIAQQVTEAVGFEFYQDVDGDLVFKPPFYNLDTSSSRVYRIEDIDIISISFNEKEPEATYCTVKSGQLTHWASTGTEGFVGNRGMYIDYRLVAQFGWRPANFEVTYFNSPKALQFVAQARLDLLNIDIHSASLTIPIRAELRPGYPVYIPFCDSFFYVTQLSHSYSVGGQCTTSLTLTARRSKFAAPALPRPIQPGENAISLVRLDRPDYPERYLQVYENGVPRWAGFPNVVMALDPLRPNPKFFMMGSGLENLNVDVNSVEMFINILREQVKTTGEGAGIFGIVPTADNDQRDRPTENTRYVLKQSDNPEDNIEFSINDLLVEFKAISDAQREIQALSLEISETHRRLVASGSQPSQINSQIRPLEERLAQVQEGIAGTSAEEGKFRVVQLIQALQNNDVIRRSIPGLFDAPSTASYLDLLSDMKASFAPGEKTPGYYRYYSCSHPDPEMQGQAAIIWDEGTGNDQAASYADTGVASQTSSLNAPQPVPIAEVVKTSEGDPTVQLSRLDQQLQALGVVDFSSRNLARSTTAEQRRRNQSWRRTPDEPIPDAVVDNLTNVGFVLQALKNALPEGVGFTVGEGYRPGDNEGKILVNERKLAEVETELQTPGLSPERKKELEKLQRIYNRRIALSTAGKSQHAAGLAVDIDVDSNDNVSAVQREVSKLAIDGLIRGFGTYANSPRRIHIDLRSESNQSCPYTYQQNKGRHDDSENNPTQQILNQVADEEGVPRVGVGTENRGCTGSTFPRPLTSTSELRKEKKKDPATKLPTPPPPAPVSRVVEPPSIKLEPQFLDEPVFVDGFIDGPLPKPEGVSRAPEAAIGRIRVERGLKVVQPRTARPKVVPTVDIQTTTFAEFVGLKQIGVAGQANEQGLFLPEDIRNFVQQNTIARFKIETEGLADDPAKTPRQILGGLYDQIRQDLLAGEGVDPLVNPDSNSFPIFSSTDLQSSTPETRFAIAEFRAVTLPNFDNAVLTEQTFSLAGRRPIADISMATLQGLRPFVAKGFGPALDKVFSAYAKVIANLVTESFVLSRASAGFVEGTKPFGFNERMVRVQDCFAEIIQTVTGRAFDPSKRTSNDIAVRVAKKSTNIYTPVFPVSDGKGYEVVGSFRYGRGLTIDPGGTFAQINSGPDPYTGVSAATAEAFLDALIAVQSAQESGTESQLKARLISVRDQLNQAQDFEQQISKAELEGNSTLVKELQGRLDRLSEIRVALSLLQESTPDAVQEIAEVNGLDPNTLRFDTPNPTMLEAKLANFPANQLRQSVLKTTVANAAYQLTDLQAHLDSLNNNSCVCMGNSSDVLLQAFSQNNFFTINDIDSESDPATASVSQQILQQLPEYLAQRKALRGEILDTQSPSLADAFSKVRDIGRAFTNLGSGLQEQGQNLADAASQFSDLDEEG